MRVKLLIVLAIASAVFMFLTGTAHAGYDASDCYGSTDACGVCDSCGCDKKDCSCDKGLCSGFESCLGAVPYSGISGLYGVSDDLVSASGFLLPDFEGAEVGNAILGELVEDDFATPDLYSLGYIPSFVPIETESEILAYAVPNCVDYDSYPFLYEPCGLNANGFDDLVYSDW